MHVELQLPHEPFMHCDPDGHARALQLVQPVNTSQSHVSTPFAVQRDAPMLHPWQLLHMPPAQSSPYAHVSTVVHEVQPCAFATHCSALPLEPQRVAPAVHWLLHV